MAYRLSNGHVLWCNMVGYPSDSLASCVHRVFIFLKNTRAIFHNFWCMKQQFNTLYMFGCIKFSIVCRRTSWMFSSWYTSHAHMVVWECCKDDRQCQWEMAKFDPQPTVNPLTGRHQIWNMWVRRGYLLSKILGSVCQWDFSPIYQKYTPKTFKCLLHFFSSSKPLQKVRWKDFRI